MPSERMETLRFALGDTLEYHSEGRTLNPHRSLNVSPRAKRRVSIRSLGTEVYSPNLTAMGPVFTRIFLHLQPCQRDIIPCNRL